MIHYVESITLISMALLLLSTMYITIPEYTPLNEQKTVHFQGQVTQVIQSNKTSLVTIKSTCELPVRVFHTIPYNFTQNQTVHGFGELSKEKEIIAQKFIAQTQVIR